MALVHWEPFQEIGPWSSFQEMESLQRQINRLFDQLAPSGNRDPNRIAFMPSAEMQETPNEVHLKLEIPGLEAKDLDIHVTEEAVSISGERKSENKIEERGKVRSEFRYGKFKRVISLPTRIQTDKVQAEYKNGVLNLILSKAEEDKQKVVKVNLG